VFELLFPLNSECKLSALSLYTCGDDWSAALMDARDDPLVPGLVPPEDDAAVVG